MRFSTYLKNKVQLDEELTKKQRQMTDDWFEEHRPHHTQLSDHVFGQKNHVDIPLEHQDEPIKPHPDVSDHLYLHGFTIKDYKNGVAEDKHGRNVRIGGALNKTKAPDDIKKAFNNDPNRAASRNSNLGIKISRPSDKEGAAKVGGMASGQPWEDQTCMRLPYGKDPDTEPGSYNYMVGEDIQRGTHIAELHNKEKDPNAEHPLARVLLKPHHGVSGEYRSHRIIRPEGTVYGNAPDSFHKTVSDWAEKHFPMKDVAYAKNKELYDDDGKTHVVNGKRLGEALDPKMPTMVRREAIKHPDIKPEHINKALDDDDSKVATMAAEHPKATKENLNKALDHDSRDVKAAAIKNQNADKDHAKKALNVNDAFVRAKAIRRSDLTDEKDITKALDDPDSSVRLAAMGHPKVNEKHVHKALDDPNWSVVESGLEHEEFVTPKHISKILDGDDSHLRAKAAQLKNASPANIKKALEDKEYFVRRGALSREDLTSEQIEKGLGDQDHSNRLKAINHKNVTPHHIDKVLSDTAKQYKKNRYEYDDKRHRLLAGAAAYHSNATPDNIHKALDHPDPEVRKMAALNSNASETNLDKALGNNEKNDMVKINAILNKNALPRHIGHALDDDNVNVREFAAKSDKANEDHILKALDDMPRDHERKFESDRVRYAAAKHENGTDKTIEKALKDKDPEVRERALENPNAKKKHVLAGLKDDDTNVRKTAVEHDLMTPDELRHIRDNDKDEDIKDHARYILRRKHKINDDTPDQTRDRIKESVIRDRVLAKYTMLT